MFKSTSTSLILYGILAIIVGIIAIAWPGVRGLRHDLGGPPGRDRQLVQRPRGRGHPPATLTTITDHGGVFQVEVANSSPCQGIVGRRSLWLCSVQAT